MHRFFFRRVFLFLLIGGLLFGVARGQFRAGYRQGFAQGAALVESDGRAVIPPAAVAGGGPGPVEFIGGALLIGFAGLLVLRAVCPWRGRGRHGHKGHDDHFGPAFRPEKPPTLYV